MKRKEPVRLHKQKYNERKPLIEDNMIAGVPIEFILITIIMIAFFLLILIFMGPCTESGLQYNMGYA